MTIRRSYKSCPSLSHRTLEYYLISPSQILKLCFLGWSESFFLCWFSDDHGRDRSDERMQQNGDRKAHRLNSDHFATVPPDASQLPSQPDETVTWSQIQMLLLSVAVAVLLNRNPREIQATWRWSQLPHQGLEVVLRILSRSWTRLRRKQRHPRPP